MIPDPQPHLTAHQGADRGPLNAHSLLAFDSGIGGFGVVAALRRHLPAARIDYLADTAVFPYGEQPDETLIPRIGSLISDAVARLQPQAVVIACNTASTLALPALRAALTVPIIGCVPPIRWAARLSRSRVIGLLATRATVRRPYVAELQSRFAPDCTLLAHGARKLADIAESAFRGEPIDPAAIAAEVAGLFGQQGGDQIDAVGIGCTHYTFLIESLRAASPPEIAWLDPADAVARQTAHVLADLAPVTESVGGRVEAGSLLIPPTGFVASRPDTAWFTAMPDRAEALARALPAFGYGSITLWEDEHPDR